jgi:hypothetical protein
MRAWSRRPAPAPLHDPPQPGGRLRPLLPEEALRGQPVPHARTGSHPQRDPGSCRLTASAATLAYVPLGSGSGHPAGTTSQLTPPGGRTRRGLGAGALATGGGSGPAPRQRWCHPPGPGSSVLTLPKASRCGMRAVCGSRRSVNGAADGPGATDPQARFAPRDAREAGDERAQRFAPARDRRPVTRAPSAPRAARGALLSGPPTPPVPRTVRGWAGPRRGRRVQSVKTSPRSAFSTSRAGGSNRSP